MPPTAQRDRPTSLHESRSQREFRWSGKALMAHTLLLSASGSSRPRAHLGFSPHQRAYAPRTGSTACAVGLARCHAATALPRRRTSHLSCPSRQDAAARLIQRRAQPPSAVRFVQYPSDPLDPEDVARRNPHRRQHPGRMGDVLPPGHRRQVANRGSAATSPEGESPPGDSNSQPLHFKLLICRAKAAGTRG